MKFHALTIENLNSLYGKHAIDFDEELSQASLFLIMGPIGAGKSTILDAICLALFGTTPRQRQVNSVSGVVEQVMSRGTGHTEITLEFSRLDPEAGRLRYRVGWYCQRAHKRPTGNMQSPQRSLDRLTDGQWEPLVTKEHRAKFFDDHFKEALAAMTLDDFLRSVLLAQGDFTAFLKADQSAKANILERLTKTEQYQRIGQRAMNRWRRAERKVNDLKQQLDVVQGLSDEDFEALQHSAKDLEEQAARQQQTVSAARTHKAWLDTLKALERAKLSAQENLQQAQQAKAKREPDFLRVDQALRAQGPATLLKQQEELTREITTQQERIHTLNEQAKTLHQALAQAQESLASKLHARQQAQKTWDDHQGPIQEARALYQRLGLAKAAKEQAQTRHETALDLVLSTKQKLKNLQQARDLAALATKEAQQELDSLSAFKELPQLLSGLSAKVDNLDQEQQRAHQAAQNAEQKSKELKSSQAELLRKEQALEPATKALLPLQAALDAANQALSTQLGGAPDAATRRQALQDQRDTTAQAQRDAEEAQKLLPQWLAAKEGLTQTTADLQTLEKALASLFEQSQTLDEHIQAAQDLCDARQQLWQSQKDIFRLVEERKKLIPNAPCPVCGSEDHPFAAEQFDDETLQRKLEDAKSAFQKAQSALEHLKLKQSDLGTQKAVKTTEQSSLLRTKEDQQKSLESLSASLSAIADRLAIPFNLAEPQRLAAHLERKQDRLRDEAQANKLALKALDQAEREQRQAQDALTTETRTLDELKNALAIARTQLKSLESSLTEAKSREKAAQDALATSRQELTEAFAKAGVPLNPATGDDLHGALHRARQQADRYTRSAQHLTDIQQAEAEKTQALNELAALLPDREQALKEAEAALLEARQTVATLKEQTQRALNGQAPDTLERRLKEALQSAQTGFESAQNKAHDLERRLSEARAALTSEQENQEKRRKKQESLDQELQQALESAGFADIQALQAAILPAETLKALQQELELITTSLTRAQTTAEDSERALVQHREIRPDDLPKDSEQADPQVFQEALQSAEEKLKTLTEELGAIRKELETEKGRRQQAAALQADLARAQEELRRWEVIQKLIGAGEGRRFKEFAQALNLERIVYHANQHLIHLHERYRLAVARDEFNHPTLEFEIIDSYRSHTTRHISTLSGGESFLVSLALALALADFRQIHMPVETLLLDEGFGTLDQESLAQAIAVLNSLHSRGQRQVGIISHVEQLQDQIEHRIHVQPQGGGRSTIVVD